MAFSPTGKIVVTGSRDRTARLWDKHTGQPLGQVLQHGGPVWAIAFSPDGRTVLTGSGLAAREWGESRLWEAATGKPLSLPLRHPGPVYAVAFHPDGRTFLTGSADGKTRLWDMVQPLPGDVKQIRCWVEVVTGMELDPHGGARVLDAPAWQERRKLLEQLGGPPPLRAFPN